MCVHPRKSFSDLNQIIAAPFELPFIIYDDVGPRVLDTSVICAPTHLGAAISDQAVVYELGKLLGQGTFAKVYHGRNIKTGDSVAIKVIDKEKVLKFGMMEQIKREISTMSLVKHTNIVELFEVMATKTKIYLVMEYVKGGELFNKVAKGRLKEEAVRKYFQQLISAVDYCHSRGVCHRDLKPENLLLDDNGNLKVSDFGLSAIADTRRQDGLLHTACGTPAYVAPEVISRKGYDGAKADVWSCGVILYVLHAGYLPFRDPNLMEMYKKITKADFKFPNWFPYELRKLLSKILDPNPKTRISVAKIIENPWFRKGFTRKSTREVRREEVQLVSDETLCEPGNNICEEKELAKVTSLNAFDIISLASGLDLSGLLEETTECKIESRFTSTQTASTIFSKFEEIAKKTKLVVVKKDGGMMMLERSKEGRMGRVSIDIEISQIALNLYLVEARKSKGDTLEYQQLWKKDIRPALKDIVWAWQGEKNDDIVEEQPQQQ